MGVVITPSSWGRQPATVASINRAHPLAQGLVFYAYPHGNTVVDLVSGNTASPIGTGSSLTVEPWNAGTARQTDTGVLCATTASTGGWQWGINKTGMDALVIASGSARFSLFGLHKPVTAATTTFGFGSYESAVVGDGVALISDDNSFAGPGMILLGTQAGGLASATARPANELTSAPTGKLHFYGFGYDATNAFNYYQGLAVYSNTITAYTNGSNGNRQTTFGQRGYNGLGFNASSTALAIAYNRILSLSEYMALWANPWAVIKQQSARFSIAAAAAADVLMAQACL
jgi:hypothetical protein